METSTAQVPQTPAPIFNRPVNISRTSHFSEGPMEEYTPANSIYRGAMNAQSDRCHLRRWMRVFNALVHLTACSLLLINMAGFLAHFQGTYLKFMTPPAIVLCVLLTVDSAIDILSLVRLRWQWPGWALLLRSACGLGYLAVFLVYATQGHVFPNQYSYWGFSPSYAGPLVYLFLWLISVWNLIHIALHRQCLGRDIWRYLAAVSALPRQIHSRLRATTVLAGIRARGQDRDRSAPDLERGQTGSSSSVSSENRPEMKTVSTVTTTSSTRPDERSRGDQAQAEIQL